MVRVRQGTIFVGGEQDLPPSGLVVEQRVAVRVALQALAPSQQLAVLLLRSVQALHGLIGERAAVDAGLFEHLQALDDALDAHAKLGKEEPTYVITRPSQY